MAMSAVIPRTTPVKKYVVVRMVLLLSKYVEGKARADNISEVT